MGLYPTPAQRQVRIVGTKKCSICHREKELSDFIPVRSQFFPDGTSHICCSCIDQILRSSDYSWDIVDQCCQTFSIPWIPTKWEDIMKGNTPNPFFTYANIFMNEEYADFGWLEYYKKFVELRNSDNLERELPIMREHYFEQLQEEWGPQYDEDALLYLESLYKGLCLSHSVTGALQTDQARKLCRLSYMIDRAFEEGSDASKLMKAYDDVVKQANFTPQNIKNLSEFDSIGELIKYMEKKGWVNDYYDDVTRDVIDETMKNMQSYNQRLYTHESGIADEIQRRLEILNQSSDKGLFDINYTDDEITEYDVEGAKQIFGDYDDEEDADGDE